MPIETNLSGSPYFETDNENYYKVGFKPSVPVQVREINELQTMLQKQIEEFGDNILKRGTIVKGCNFTFYNKHAYIKIKDLQLDGNDAVLSNYEFKILENQDGVTAFVTGYEEGYEASDPDLKTLYIRYRNAGRGGNTSTFSTNNILTVYDNRYTLNDITIAAGGSSYSNDDVISFCSALVVDNTSSNTFSAGHLITQTTTNAQATVVEVNTTIFDSKVVLKIKPLSSDISSGNTDAWAFTDEYEITSANSGAVAEVVDVVGSGATGTLITDSAGKIVLTQLVSPGSRYYIEPYAVALPTSGGSGANLVSENYIAKVVVSSLAESVGEGYAFGVSEGTIYQKGYFVHVDRQTVIVDKYSIYPNNVSVGFRTEEEMVSSAVDTSLLDNALGTENYTAPGADRLKLTPILTVLDTDVARANADFFPVVEFSQGLPYKQNQSTVYSRINDELAIRTKDQAGDFVVDRFLVTTKPVTNTDFEANTFTLVVDPGTAYVDGYRIRTLGNYELDSDKGIGTKTTNNVSTSLDYGNYVLVDNLVGFFPADTGNLLELYNSAGNYLEDTATVKAGTISASGSQLGTARIRAVVLEDGIQGTPDAVYRIYLFDIAMNAGKSFGRVRSIYYNGASLKGKATIITENTATESNVAVLKETTDSSGRSKDSLIYKTGFISPLSINNYTYEYRKVDETNVEIANTGLVSITLSGDEYFTRTGSLGDTGMREFIFVPQDNLEANAFLTGTVAPNTGNTLMVGSSTGFLTDLSEGDYVKISSNSVGGYDLKRVIAINSNTSITLDSNCSFANTSARLTRYFPKWVPIPFGNRSELSISINAASRVMTANVGTRLAGSSNTDIIVSYNVQVANSTISQKTPKRSRYVKICVANNATGFGYKGYGGANNVAVTASSNTVTGTSTAFSTHLNAGDKVEISGTVNSISFAKTFQIATVTNATSLELSVALNFTASGLSMKKMGNLEGPWCLGVPDIFRLRNVYKSANSTVTTNSPNVTEHFVIDHNQNQNYYDLGFLVKKKDSVLTIRPTDYILAEFDCFTSSGKIHHINSYVEGNTELRFETDSKALSALGSTAMDVNTFEITPFVNKQGETFHPVNCLDFRPYVSNTANVNATDVSGATINPAYTVAFNSSDKKFPVPDSIASYNITEFMGRIDSVILNKRGRINTIQGTYTTDLSDSPSLPAIAASIPELGNRSAILLNALKVPAYPNITTNLTPRQRRIVDTGVISERALENRLKRRTITPILSASDVAVNQPQTYTASDIGNIDRRVKDLEFYVALTLTELDIRDKVIPSSIDSSINRFKFGYYVDSFRSYERSDVENPEFKAAISRTRVIPGFNKIVIEHDDSLVGCECDDFLVVSQEIATGDTAIDARSLETISYASRVPYTSSLVTNTDLVMASYLGSNAGSVSVFMYNYDLPTKLEVYQARTPSFANAILIHTTEDSVALTNNDIRTLQSSQFFSAITAENLRKHTIVSTDKLKFGGKISFSHSVTNGIYYRFKTTFTGSASSLLPADKDYKIGTSNPVLRVDYPVNGSQVSGNNDPCTTAPPRGYVGTLTVKNERRIDVGSHQVGPDMFDDDDDTLYDHFTVQGSNSLNGFRILRCAATGLKPSTKHKFYVDDVNRTKDCDTTLGVGEIGTLSGLKDADTKAEFKSLIGLGMTEIMTDNHGKATFELYLSLKEATPEFEETKKVGEHPFSMTFKFEIYNSDQSSYAKTEHGVTVIYTVKPKPIKPENPDDHNGLQNGGDDMDSNDTHGNGSHGDVGSGAQGRDF